MMAFTYHSSESNRQTIELGIIYQNRPSDEGNHPQRNQYVVACKKEKAGTQPGLRLLFLLYLQQRNGTWSLAAKPNVPVQALPLSSAAEAVGSSPAKTGQSPPQVKQTLHATAVCAFVTAGVTVNGNGFPFATPPIATLGANSCAFAEPAFTVIPVASISANNPILLYIRTPPPSNISQTSSGLRLSDEASASVGSTKQAKKTTCNCAVHHA
jgi:hypothetical protein